MATVDEVIDKLSRHRNNEYLVVDVKSAMRELKNPREDLETVLIEPSVSEWHLYALEGVRSIVESQVIESNDFRVILDSTKRMADRFGTDEFYKTFDVLGRIPENARFLTNFASDLLNTRDHRDWLWLAFSATATLLDRLEKIDPFQRTFDASLIYPLAQELVSAYQSQPESLRKPQMQEILRKMPIAERF
jgi:hypothetical protein